MSVSFFIASNPNQCPDTCMGTAFECEAGDCELCQAFSAWGAENEVNMANGNAVDVMIALGVAYDEALCGSIRAGELIEKCDALLRTPKDASIPNLTQGNFIECGRREGYLHEKAEHLKRLAAKAGDIGRIVFG